MGLRTVDWHAARVPMGARNNFRAAGNWDIRPAQSVLCLRSSRKTSFPETKMLGHLKTGVLSVHKHPQWTVLAINETRNWNLLLHTSARSRHCPFLLSISGRSHVRPWSDNLVPKNGPARSVAFLKLLMVHVFFRHSTMPLRHWSRHLAPLPGFPRQLSSRRMSSYRAQITASARPVWRSPRSGPTKLFQIMSLWKIKVISSFPKHGYICVTSCSKCFLRVSCSASIANHPLPRFVSLRAIHSFAPHSFAP